MSTYDAFVSYSHAEDRGVAQRLRTRVEKFAKPWFRPRALRLFLDVSSLSADPGLWSSIERALADSSWFVLVTSPGAAHSKWVDREIRWWLENRSANRLLIVVAEGTLSWDYATGDFDAVASTALPSALLGALEEEPYWVTVGGGDWPDSEPTDAELVDAVVKVAAALRGVRAEDLEGTAVQEQRRTRRWIAGVIAGLSLLLLAAVVAGLVALNQRSNAIGQARLALSRQVATVSQGAAGSNLNVAMQLAVQAYRADANPQTRAALLNASTTSPHLVRFIDAGAEVTSLAGSGDGEVAVAALDDGRVQLWDAAEGGPELLFELPEAGTGVAVNEDGSVVAAAAAEEDCMLWQRGEEPVQLPVPYGMACGAVGLSPSGRTVIYSARFSEEDEAEEFSLYDEERVVVATVGDLANSELHPFSVFSSIDFIAVPSDDQALLVSPGYWAWKDLDDWSGSSSGVGVGAHTLTHIVSADGGLAIVTSGGSRVPIWRTNHPVEYSEPDLSIEAPLPSQAALALSPDGSRVAVAGPGQIYVAPTFADGEETAEVEAAEGLTSRPLSLTGEDAELLAFAGDSHLLSATGSEIAIWDTEQLDRLARPQPVPLQPGCTACGPPSLAVSPDGERVAVVGGFGETGFVQSLSGAPEREVLPSSESEYELGAPVWKGDSSLVAFPMWPSAGGSEAPELEQDLPDDVRLWPAWDGEAYEVTDAATSDGDSAVLVDSSGEVHWHDLETGEQIDSVPPPDTDVSNNGEVSTGAVSPSGRLLALTSQGEVTVEALPGREVVGRIDTNGFSSVAYVGPHLLVQHEDGRLEVWDERGQTLRRTLGGSGTVRIAASADGDLVARSLSDGTVSVEDLTTGAELATFRTPAESSFFKTGIAFSPDGRLLVALSELPGEDGLGALVLRDISDANLIRTACEAAGAELTPAQWSTFVGTDPPDDLSCR